MSADNVETASYERISLLNELQNLLEKLLQLARQGDSTNEHFDAVIAKADSLVGKINQFGPIGSGEIQHRFERLRQLYETLSLVISVQKADVSEELNRIRRGKKIIAVYHKNV